VYTVAQDENGYTYSRLIGGTTMLSALNALSMRAIEVVSDYDIKEVKDEGLASIFSEGHAGNMASEFIPQERPVLPVPVPVLALPVPTEIPDAGVPVADETAEFVLNDGVHPFKTKEDISLARECEEQRESVEPPCPEDSSLIETDKGTSSNPKDTTLPAECQGQSDVVEENTMTYTYRIPDNDSYKARLLGMFAQNLVITHQDEYPDGTTRKVEMSLNMYRAYLKTLSWEETLSGYHHTDDHYGWQYDTSIEGQEWQWENTTGRAYDLRHLLNCIANMVGDNWEEWASEWIED